MLLYQHLGAGTDKEFAARQLYQVSETRAGARHVAGQHSLGVHQTGEMKPLRPGKHQFVQSAGLNFGDALLNALLVHRQRREEIHACNRGQRVR